MKLVQIQLSNNDFILNQQYYQQITGIAMGWSPAPTSANLYLKPLDQRINNCNPWCYLRYLDDLLWFAPNRRVAAYVQEQVASWKQNISVEWRTDGEKWIFLDVMVSKVEGRLLHRIYVKATSSRSMLHALSFHPDHTLKASFTLSFLRYLRLSSREEDARK